jgi:translation initiation factor 3 subunit I
MFCFFAVAESTKPVVTLVNPKARIQQARWGPGNEQIVCGCEDGSIIVWDPESGEQLEQIKAHELSINTIEFSQDKTMFITASSDMTAQVRRLYFSFISLDFIFL